MKAIQFTQGATTINKIQFCEIEDYLAEKGINVNDAFELLADENEFVFLSNGFVFGLKEETLEGEWHHYFVKVDGFYEARKFNFN